MKQQKIGTDGNFLARRICVTKFFYQVAPMPGKSIIEIPEATQAAMLKELSCLRYGFLLTIHILLLCAPRARTQLRLHSSCSALDKRVSNMR
jgi:hypothetical protein